MPFYAAGAIAALGGVIALLMAIFSTAGVDTVISDATSVATTAKQRNDEVAKQKPQEDDLNKSYSLDNLMAGIVATLPVPKDKDADKDDPAPPPISFKMRADEAGPMITKSTIAALAEYAAGPDAEHTRDIYYANFTVQGLSGSMTQRSCMLLEEKDQPEWIGATDGQGGHYINTRTITFRVWVASQLSSSVDDNSAQTALRNAIATDKGKGLLWDKLRKAVIAELKATGQLEGITEKQLEKLDFTDHLTVNVTQISSTLYPSAKGHIKFSDIVSTSGIGMLVNGRPPRAVKNIRNDAEFAVSEIGVTLILSPIKAPGADAQEEPAE